ncbi:NRDE family protein [Polaribacter sp.]|nr:NRDE family protein [Polaribacter sp.]
MCTVTYIPLQNDDFILTSNRDESPLRRTLVPSTYKEDEVELTYPKDEIAGGTWIGHSSRKRVVCLLNGGFEKHKRELSYRMSRGVIVKKILAVEDAVVFIDQFNFTEIEPFTIVLVTWEDKLKAYELVWDGQKKHFSKLKKQPSIWSSATLYTEKHKKSRKKWFKEWLSEKHEFTEENIKKFHLDDSLGDESFSFKMKRDNVQTVSVTSILKKGDDIQMNYQKL